MASLSFSRKVNFGILKTISICWLPLLLIPSLPVWGQGGFPVIEIEPGKKDSYYVWCEDQFGNPYWSGSLVFYQGVYNNSGGHLHNTNRPVCSLNFPNGYSYIGPPGLQFEIDAGHSIGQWEQITPCCTYGCATWDLAVQFWPLYNLFQGSAPAYTVPIGTDPPYHIHPENHFGTSTLAPAVAQIVDDYHGEFYCVPDPSPPDYPNIRGYDEEGLGVNDMALEQGGIFDINGDWHEPHGTHNWGNAVDFRCKPNADHSIIHVNPVILRFLQLCRNNGLFYAIHHDQAGEHVHCSVSEAGY